MGGNKMADTRNKISYFLEQVKYWLPSIIQDETQKQRLKQQLENAIKEITARGEETRTTVGANLNADIIKALYSPEFFKGRPYAEQGMAQYLQKTNPDVFAATGYQMPPDTGQVINTAVDAAKKVMMAEMAGETPNEEDVRQLIMSQGGEPAQEAISEIIKVQEAAKERPIKEREAAVKEKGIPLREREVAVSEGELKARWKELAGKIGDMTAKEARDELNKLGVERRGYQEKLSKKTDAFGGPLSEDQLRGLKSNIAEIKRLEDKIDSKHGKAMEDEYKAIADDLKGKRYTAADLDTDEQIRSILTEKGYNIDALKKYMR
jgi:hypothetical protein